MREVGEALASAAEDKRRHPRVNVNLAASVVDISGETSSESHENASLLNVARGGVFVATALCPKIGQAVKVRFRMLATRVCEASGSVVRRSGTGFGIEFARTNHEMDCFLRSLTTLPPRLHPVYLADVLEPQITVS